MSSSRRTSNFLARGRPNFCHLGTDLSLEAETLVHYTTHLKVTRAVALQSWNFPNERQFPVGQTSCRTLLLPASPQHQESAVWSCGVVRIQAFTHLHSPDVTQSCQAEVLFRNIVLLVYATVPRLSRGTEGLKYPHT